MEETIHTGYEGSQATARNNPHTGYMKDHRLRARNNPHPGYMRDHRLRARNNPHTGYMRDHRLLQETIHTQAT